MINYLKSMLYTISIILICTVILTIFNYFNIINGTILKIIMLIIPPVAVSIGSFKIGIKSNKKGYIEGLKYGIIWILIFLTINFITKNFTLSSIIYFIILLLISILSGVFGINRKKN